LVWPGLCCAGWVLLPCGVVHRHRHHLPSWPVQPCCCLQLHELPRRHLWIHPGPDGKHVHGPLVSRLPSGTPAFNPTPCTLPPPLHPAPPPCTLVGVARGQRCAGGLCVCACAPQPRWVHLPSWHRECHVVHLSRGAVQRLWLLDLQPLYVPMAFVGIGCPSRPRGETTLSLAHRAVPVTMSCRAGTAGRFGNPGATSASCNGPCDAGRWDGWWWSSVCVCVGGGGVECGSRPAFVLQSWA
jgi:hypothetical protein